MCGVVVVVACSMFRCVALVYALLVYVLVWHVVSIVVIINVAMFYLRSIGVLKAL